MGEASNRKVENSARRRAFIWLASTEQTLHALTGSGWHRFKLPADESDEALAAESSTCSWHYDSVGSRRRRQQSVIFWLASTTCTQPWTHRIAAGTT
eukprot:2647864-Amphidinium_carterae.1